MNSLGAITKTLCALEDDGKKAVETSFKLLLYAMTGFERDEKNKQLQLAVPFIKDWAIANVGEYFLCGSGEDIQNEHQVSWVYIMAIDINSLLSN